MPSRIRVARAWFIGLGDSSPDAMIAASFIRAVELLLGERVNLAASIADEIRAGLTTRDAATTEREDAIHADGYVKGLREALRLLRGEEKGGPG